MSLAKDGVCAGAIATLAPLRDATPDHTGAARMPDTVRWVDLVVGRPVIGAPDPREAAERIGAEIRAAIAD